MMVSGLIVRGEPLLYSLLMIKYQFFINFVIVLNKLPLLVAVYKVLFTAYTIDDDVSDVSISDLNIFKDEVVNCTCEQAILGQRQTTKLIVMTDSDD